MTDVDVTWKRSQLAPDLARPTIRSHEFDPNGSTQTRISERPTERIRTDQERSPLRRSELPMAGLQATVLLPYFRWAACLVTPSIAPISDQDR